MNIKISKSEAQNQIEKFFGEILNKSPKEIKKIKHLAMNKKIPLKEKRKLFCKKCLMPYKNSKIKIREKIKSGTCENCGYINRWRLK
jgi:RNase P subunit RPR2